MWAAFCTASGLGNYRLRTTVLWHMTSCSLSGGYRRLGGTYCLRLAEKMRQLISMYQTTRRHIPKYRIMYRCMNIRGTRKREEKCV